MASHVVVIDSTARRATVKVTPTKMLTEVLAEACSKLGVNPLHYGLKHQKKQIDLSLPFRLCNLSSGAKLELVQLSKSPSVVAVALQLPEQDAGGEPNNRIVDKFPSTTTLWQILRKFESGVAGNGVTRNFTGRTAPLTVPGASGGTGRLFYQTPVVHIMDRELSSFTDLQKSLAQLGFNSGSTLLRLSYRTTDQPLEEAMADIEGYFRSSDADVVSISAPSSGEEEAASSNVETPVSFDAATSTSTTEAHALTLGVDGTVSGSPPIPQEQTVHSSLSQASTTAPSTTVVSSRPVTIYAPPAGSTPQSAQFAYNENDYIPTVDHAKMHQRRLNMASRPTRLSSDAELAAQETASNEKLDKVVEVEVKIRFPDQTQVVSKFNQQDTTQSLYEFVRSCLAEPVANEKFSLSFFGVTNGSGPSSTNPKVIPESTNIRLIRDMRMSGRVLVNFIWDMGAGIAARQTGAHILRRELTEQATQIKVEDVSAANEESEEASGSAAGQIPGPSTEGSRKTKGGGGLPKWLKLPGKK